MSYPGKESYISGRRGEEIAAEYIKQQGFFIAARNYRYDIGEIDIIAENRKFVVFIEVKTRKENAGYFPKEAITKDKQRRIIHTAKNYMYRSHTGLIPRFDIIEVTIPENGDTESAEVSHIENAFEVRGNEFY